MAAARSPRAISIAAFTTALSTVALIATTPVALAGVGGAAIAGQQRGAARSSRLIVGTWGTKAGKLQIASHYERGGKAAWKALSRKGVVGVASGTWRIDKGNHLVQYVRKSTIPGLPPHTTLNDYVHAIDDKAMVLKHGGKLEGHERLPDRIWAKLNDPKWLAAMKVRAARSSKASEANEVIDRIKKAAADYYRHSGKDQRTGRKLPCVFPDTTPLTPNGKSCCARTLDRNSDKKCDGRKSDWSARGWRQMGFSLNRPHYFQYRIESKGEGAKARFTVTAHADLDCDGIRSTFQLVMVGQGNKGGACKVGTSAIFRDQETE